MRNPFRLRVAQRAVMDDQFVKLFGPGVLDLIDKFDDPWESLVFLRSAPGGGKSSFLRLLTPHPLKLASVMKDDGSTRSTNEMLRKYRAIDENGPCLLGVLVTFLTEYRDLEEIDRGGGLFRSLLNARIVIATMRALLERSDRIYPDDLDTISAKWTPDTNTTIPAEATGQELYEWAAEIEGNFYDRLDDLDGQEEPARGHIRFDALTWFSTAKLTDAHGQVRAKRLLLLDDLQNLSVGQRRQLTDLLINARAHCGIWVSERMEALNHQEVLSEGALRGRDFDDVVQLESSWAGRIRSYSKFVSHVAELRAKLADGFEDRDFFASLSEADDSATWDIHFKDACEKIQTNIIDRAGSDIRFQDWIKSAQEFSGNPYEHARKWRELLILIERELGRKQSTLQLSPLSDEEYDNKQRTGVGNAAEHFLRYEYEAPIYFGRETLAAVSSNNVDQYVEVAGDLFDEISAKIAGPRSPTVLLNTEDQHRIIKRTAKNRWDSIPRRLPHGYDARRLLEAAAEF